MQLFKSPILLAIIGYFLYLFMKSRSSQDVQNGYATGGGYTVAPPTQSPVTNLDGSVKVFATISKAKSQTLADQLYEELFAITSDSKILSLLRGLNEADFIMIDVAFGLRASGIAGFGADLSLAEYIIKDCSASTIKALKKQFPNIF